MKRLLTFTTVLVVLLAPLISFGQEGLVPACPTGDASCEEAFAPDNYGACEFLELTNNLIRFVLGLTAVIAMIAILYAGYLFVVSQGDAATIERGKQFILNVMIGFVIMLTAYLVVSTVLNVLLGTGENNLDWARLECSYAYRAGDPKEINVKLANLYEYDDEGFAIGYRSTTLTSRTVTMTRVTRTVNGREVVSYESSNPALAGSCEIVTSGYCTPANLAPLFPGNADAASRVCAQESGGVSQWSKTDLCKDGSSFSGGWFQINIIAHANLIPGCAGAFATYGKGIQGSCLEPRTSRNGIRYCAVRDCEVIDVNKYDACRRAVEQWSVNSSIASELYKRSGNDFTDWANSAGLCGAPY